MTSAIIYSLTAKPRTILRSLTAEQKKVRRKKIWLVPLGFLSFESVWALWLFSRAHPEELVTGYLKLFYQLPVMNTVIMPVMIAVIASRLNDMEIKGDTLKLLYTMQRPDVFFDCKYISGAKYLLLFTAGQCLLILALGKAFGFEKPIKLPMLMACFFVTFCTALVLLSIQQTMSLLSKSQIMPLAAGLAGSFLGLFSLFFPAPLARLVIWGYFAAFPCVSMNWDRSTRITEYYELPFPLYAFFTFAAVGILIFILCRSIVVKKEV